VVLFAPSPGGPATFPYADKVVHAAVFALVTGAGIWRFGRVRAVLAAAAAYAVASEFAQGLLLPGRQGDPVDALADLVGALGVWVLASRPGATGPRPGRPGL
jgi:VanZ family protein